jgi:hypothetical protein
MFLRWVWEEGEGERLISEVEKRRPLGSDVWIEVSRAGGKEELPRKEVPEVVV